MSEVVTWRTGLFKEGEGAAPWSCVLDDSRYDGEGEWDGR